MRRARFSLRIEIPETLDGDVQEEIRLARDAQDTDDGAMLRWLSSEFLSDLEAALSAQLPEGFYCKIENGVALP